MQISTDTSHYKIIQVINHFGVAIDLRDWSSFRNLFAEEVNFDYSSIGEVAATLVPEEIARNARQDLAGFESTQHLITNHLVEVNDHTAKCHAHVRAMHYLPNEIAEPFLEMGGYYNAELIQKNSHWKIQSWKFFVLWSRGNHNLFALARKNNSIK